MAKLHDIFDSLLSYVAATIAILTDINWMAMGGFVLLICKLIVDVPPAYNKIKKAFKKR